MTRSAALAALVLAALLAASPAMAQTRPGIQTIYKLVDKKGKVTYVDKAPPKGYEGQVTRIDVDLNANRATLSRAGEPAAQATTLPLTAPELRRVKAEAELKQAKDALEAAKKALKDGEEPAPDEIQWMGKVGGGARPVPTEAYHARMKKLEDAVKDAEAALDKAYKEARQASID